MVDLWTVIAAERRSLADDLADLSASQWGTRSLCTDWTVREALAHMTSTAAMTPPGFLLGMASAGFNFRAFSARGVRAHLGDSPADTLARFRAQQDSTSSPPGPKTSWLGETLIHAEDIRRPLGIAHSYPVDAVRQVADFYKGSNTLIGAKKRIAGVRLVATDTDWGYGDGPLVQGPLMSLLMAMTGRRVALDDLTGDGVPVLRGR